MSLEADITQIKQLVEARPPKSIFKPAGPDELNKRKEDRLAAIQAQTGATSDEWYEIARAELSRELAVAIDITDNDGGDVVSMEAVGGEGDNGERAWIVYQNEGIAEAAAIERVKNDLENEPSVFNKQWLQSFVKISDTDRRILAQEESDNYVDEVLQETDVLEEAGVMDEYNELDGNDDAQEELLDSARDTVRERKYDEIYDALEDPIQYFVHDQGMYNEEDLLKLSFITIDIDEAAEDAVTTDGVAHFLDNYDCEAVELPSGAVAFGTH